MNAEPRPLHDTIRDALAEHGAALDATVPEFDVILTGHRRHTRRLLASATLAVALLGMVGVVVATNRPSAPIESTPAASVGAGPDTSPDNVVRTDTTTERPSPVEFFCTDPLGEDHLGRQLFGSCEPDVDGIDGDFACTDRVGTENGFVIFSSCEGVGQLGPIPGADSDAPFDNPDDIPVRATTYVIQPGDVGIKIAEEFCVSVATLEAANGWADVNSDFPVPGNEILIPKSFHGSSCEVGSYTITDDDRSRIAVADRFCISVQALDAANLDTPGYDSFFPGLTIIVPPSSTDTC